MLTRLEVDGFKNLVDFAVDLGPFTCVAGPNAAGKSNLFDAIRFLSLLADKELVDAASAIRSDDEASADPRRLFWTDGETRATRMRFAAEMIVPRTVVDDFGREASPSTTFLRYEVEIGVEAPDRFARLGGLRLLREELRPIRQKDAPGRVQFPHNARNFRNVVISGRRAGPLISTEHKTEHSSEGHIRVHQDGQGRPARSHLRPPRTLLSTTTTDDQPTILAARRELQSWRLVALEPSAMRRASRFVDRASVGSDGAHLASTLYRLANARSINAGPPPEDFYAGFAGRLSRLIGVRGVRVDRDDAREQLTLEVQEPGSAWFSTRSLSEGTLRFLALSLIAADPDAIGITCLEEPENGIHPARIEAVMDLLQTMAVDPSRAPGLDNPFRQVIINTHSPRLVQAVLDRQLDVLLARTSSMRSETTQGRPTRALRLEPIHGDWRCSPASPGVSPSLLANYLSVPLQGQSLLGLRSPEEPEG